MYHLQKNWQSLLETPEVRDLAWVLFSPSLLDDNAAVKCMGNTFLGIDTPSFDPLISHIKKLDKEPEPLLKILKNPSPKKLGDYFETLIFYILNHLPCCHKIERNIHIKNGPTSTGEFDFLFFSDVLHHTIHWEVAVKFYLLDSTGIFRGINPHDTLGDKIIKLSRQVELGKGASGRKFLTSMNLLPYTSGSFVKGTLFYPLDEEGNFSQKITSGVASDHLFGWWDSIGSDFWKKRTQEHRLVNLSRLEWLAPRLYKSEPPPFREEPGLIACLQEEDGVLKEVERGILVSQNWPNPVQ